MSKTFDEFQREALRTAFYPNRGKNIGYPTLGLVGEAGEIANKVKKIYRDSGGIIGEEAHLAIAAEIGDVLWYCAALAEELGVPLSSIASGVIEKLTRRGEAGTLTGAGDAR